MIKKELWVDVSLSPYDVAELIWNMNSGEQAELLCGLNAYFNKSYLKADGQMARAVEETVRHIPTAVAFIRKLAVWADYFEQVIREENDAILMPEPPKEEG